MQCQVLRGINRSIFTDALRLTQYLHSLILSTSLNVFKSSITIFVVSYRPNIHVYKRVQLKPKILRNGSRPAAARPPQPCCDIAQQYSSHHLRLIARF